MKKIQEDIKNRTFKPVYLLCGEEGYLKLQYRQRLAAAVMPEEDSMNSAFFEGRGVDPGEVVSLAETMPFFAEHRLIVLQDTGFFKNKCDELADYLAGDLPDYLCMVFVESEVDKRSRMYKAVKKAGRVAEFARQDIKTLTKWVLGRIGREGKKITRHDLELFLVMAGTDMGNIDCELEKLLSYTMGCDVITREDIRAVCTPQITNRIFDMVRAVTDKKQERALQLYYDLLSLREPPMRILFLLARQFNQLLEVKELASAGMDQGEIASRLGLPPFAVRNAASCAGRYSESELRGAVEDCIQSEEAVKTGKLEDRLSVELLIVKYSSSALDF